MQNSGFIFLTRWISRAPYCSPKWTSVIFFSLAEIKFLESRYPNKYFIFFLNWENEYYLFSNLRLQWVFLKLNGGLRFPCSFIPTYFPKSVSKSTGLGDFNFYNLKTSYILSSSIGPWTMTSHDDPLRRPRSLGDYWVLNSTQLKWNPYTPPVCINYASYSPSLYLELFPSPLQNEP